MTMPIDSSAPQSFHRRRFRWRGPVGVVLLTPAVAIALFSAPLSADNSWLHLSIQAVAWLTFLAGAAARFWATLYIGGRKERQLVTEGPFSLSRNPLYVGSLLLGVSAALFLESPIFLAALVAVTVIYMQATVPTEEAVLHALHGQRYEAYCRLVPRYWPRDLTVDTPPIISVDVHRLWLECCRASRWMWLPILGTAFTHLRTLDWWPKIFPSL
jgi:protein-S-isoprenylcysteine O-methyltransferase Ste14